jgi:hypothetical protein
MTETLERLFEAEQYSISPDEKRRLLLSEFSQLDQWHHAHCVPYRKILDGIGYSNASQLTDYTQIPFLPVGLFKNVDLLSIPRDEIVRTLTSSGTTGASVSRVYVDRETSVLQTKALASIVTSFIGNKRLPMILVDSRSQIEGKEQFSARTAGLLGLSNFGRDHLFLLNANMEIDLDALTSFLDRHRQERVLIFGFTFMIWRYLYQQLVRHHPDISLKGSVVIHGGGWKKLQDEAVDSKTFKSSLKGDLGVADVHDYYGMVEQVGSIFMECAEGYFHAPNFADVLIRSPKDFSVLAEGEEGLIQCLSVLPRSYPGHSLLTEDLGFVQGFDACTCGRRGTFFKVTGRIPKSDLRGCSDTYEEPAATTLASQIP